MNSSPDSPYVLTFGETMALLKASTTGPLAHVGSMVLGVGGSESNVAIGLCRLGTDAAWVGRVGSDALGERVARELRAEGVRVHAIVDPDAPTGLMLKERRTATTAKVLYYRRASAGSRLRFADLPQNLIRNAAILHVTGITAALSESALQAVTMAMELARKNKVLVSFDLNYRRALWSEELAKKTYLQLIPLADVVFAGDEEAAVVVGHAAPDELARRLSNLGPTHAIIKLGSSGAVATVAGLHYAQQAIPINPIDTVGAGDAFVAGYLSDLTQGRSPQEALLTAVTAGAFVCLSDGDWEGLPRRSEFSLLTDPEPVTR